MHPFLDIFLQIKSIFQKKLPLPGWLRRLWECAEVEPSRRALGGWVPFDSPGLADSSARSPLSPSLELLWSELSDGSSILSLTVSTLDWGPLLPGGPGSCHHWHPEASRQLWSPHCRTVLSTSLASLAANYSQIMGRDTVARSRGGRAMLGN